MTILRADAAIQTIKADFTATDLANTKTGFADGKQITGTRGIDSYTVSLLHFDGSNDSTTITDETGKVWTPQADAKLKTAVKAYGSASLYLDGTGDYISTPDSDDFYLGTGNWTIEWCMYPTVFSTDKTHGICGQYVDNNNFWCITFYQTIIYIELMVGGVSNCNYSLNVSPYVSSGSWHHIAVVRQGTDIGLYIDGIARTLTPTTAVSTNEFTNMSAPLTIGFDDRFNRYYQGYLDEFRISKGVARYNAKFIPGAPYGG